MNKNLVIYHKIKNSDCPDGLAAAWCCSQVLPQSTVYLGWQYQSEDLPDLTPYSHIYIVDFSFPAKILEQWADEGKKLFVIDHHKTAMNDLSNLSDRIFSIFDMNESGATLTWKKMLGDDIGIPAFLQYVKDRDLWIKELPETDMIFEAMSTFRYSLRDFGEPRLKMIFTWFDYLSNLNQDELLAYLRPIGEPLIIARQKKVREIAAKHKLIFLKDRIEWQVPVVYLSRDGSEDRYTSDVCHALCKDYTDSPFAACITSDNTCSLRSDADISNCDVSAIAKQFGGGGHHNASGFKDDTDWDAIF